MKALKLIIAGCLVLIGVGVAGTGVTLGQMYKTNQTVFEMTDQKDLKATALKNIYIESSVPVRIMPTEGKPYVTFSANGSGVMFPEPQFKLDVTSEGDSSHISLRQIQRPEIYIFTSDQNQELVVYLPQEDIETLKVKTSDHYYYPQESFSYTSTANIKNLSLDVGSIDLDLNGGYTNVDIKAQRGNVNIQSTTPAKVKVSGGGIAHLEGQIETVDVGNNQRSNYETISINSQLPAKVNIQNSYGETIVDGQLSELTLGTEGSSIVVNSSTPYNANIHASSQVDLKLKGKIQNAIVEGQNGEVKLYPTDTPKRIEILGDQMNVHAVLPEAISGFEIKKQIEYYGEDYQNYQDSDVYIDFDVKSENLNNQLRRIYYGDEAMKMFIGSRYGSVYITK